MLVSHLLLNCDIPIGRVIRRMEHERSSQYRFLHGFYWGSKRRQSGDGPAARTAAPRAAARAGLGGGAQRAGPGAGDGADQGGTARRA